MIRPNPTFVSALLLNATNYTLIDLENVNVETVLFQCRTAVDVLFSNDPTPAQAYGTLKAGQSLPYQVEGGSIGPIRGDTKVTDGSLTGSSTAWTKGAAWQDDADVAEKFADGVTTLSQAGCAAVIGEIYEVVWTISEYATDTITASFGGVNGVAMGADGAFKEYVKATGTTALTFTPTNTNRCHVNTVAVYKLTGNLLFAKASAGTPYLEIFYLK